MYLVYKDGLLSSDLDKLVLHAQLPLQTTEIIRNLDLLGIRTARNLKDSRPVPLPLFPPKIAAPGSLEEYALSRFEPAVQSMLEHHTTGSLDPVTFPYTKPPLDLGQTGPSLSATSLRTAKPTWAKTKSSSSEPRQRVIVFMAGGATYSESRACYEVGRRSNKEIVLVTSHMLTPALFVRQVGDLSVDKRRLGIPAEQPKPQAPAHLFEKEEPKPAPSPAPMQASASANSRTAAPHAAPSQAMAGMSLSAKQNGNASAPSSSSHAPPTAKLTKEKDVEKKDKKKHHFFSSKRK